MRKCVVEKDENEWLKMTCSSFEACSELLLVQEG